MLADIGIGILIAIFASKYFAIELSLKLVAFGVLFTILPDLDFIPYLFNKKAFGQRAHEHRNLFHYPIFYLIIGSIISLFFGYLWFFLFLFGAIAHFLHDSVGIGWGVKWFYPFNKKNYKFFAGQFSNSDYKIISSWNDQELEEVIEKYGNKNWFKDIYLSFSLINIVESLIFIISVVLLAYFMK